MRSRTIHLACLAALVVAMAFPARPSQAASVFAAGDSPATVHVFGSFSPGLGDISRFGYGMELRWRLSGHLAASLDATRLSNAVAPFGLGVVYAPASPRAFHPWIEMGATYLRVTDELSVLRGNLALSSGGAARDYFPRPTSGSVSGAVGPYFGAGVSWSTTRHIGVFGGARAYSWKESTFSKAPWDGAVVFRSGLEFSF